jgi:D-ribose pyranose/furanose isomerase RbsD
MSISNHNWVAALDQTLPVMGHRNWIVVADAAFPAQNASGIEMLTTDADELSVLTGVLHRIDQAEHVRGIIHLDSELDVLSNDDAPGVDQYREKLGAVLGNHKINTAPHEDIIRKIGAAGQSFKILVIKTGIKIPYTSVFIELGCGYWDSEREARLRQTLSSQPSQIAA